MSIRSKWARGYTVIEVMVSMSLLVIATAGIAALQKITTFSNMRSKQLNIGTHLASTWMERLRTDAVTWNYPSPSYPAKASDLGDTVWLQQILTQPNVWIRPTEHPTRGSPGFDALGNDVPLAAADSASYCTHLRLNWMYPPAPAGVAIVTSELIRAEVRVFWLREGGPGPIGASTLCSPSLAPTEFDVVANTPLARFHSVYLTSSISKNTAQ